MSLAAKHIKLVKQTAPLVAENSLKITQNFFPTMFANNPETLRYFNKINQSKGAQQEALAHAVVAYAQNIENIGNLTGVFEKINQRHIALSITPDLYNIVHKNLVIAIKDTLGDQISSEVAEAWSEAIQSLAQILINKENKIRADYSARLGGWKGEKTFVLTRKEEVVRDIVQFDFQSADGYSGPYEFTAGQYLTIRSPQLIAAPRHYTITSAPGDNVIQCTTKFHQGGQMSTFMHKRLEVGDEVTLGVPVGGFTPKEGNAVLISNGIGITPMLGLLRHYPKEQLKAVFSVHYTELDQPFLKEFEAKGVDTTFKYSINGRPDLAKETSTLVQKGGLDANYYLCGANVFTNAVNEELKKLGVKNIHHEVFGTGSSVKI